MAWLWWLLGCLLVLLALLTAVGIYLYRFTLIRPTKQAPEPTGVWKEVAEVTARETAWLEGLPHTHPELKRPDGLTLRAMDIPADKPSKRYVVAVHGYQADRMMEYARMARFYRDQGCNLLLPDNRAHGDSDGKKIGFGWKDRLDVIAWCQLLVEKYGPDIRILLQGVSMGAATVMCAVGEKSLPPQVVGAVEDCGYTSAMDEFGVQLKEQFHLPRCLLWPASLVCRVVDGWWFSQCSPLQQVKKAKIPMLFIHGEADTYVPTRFVHPLYDACPTSKELLLVPDAGHALSYYTHRCAYEAAVLRCMKRCGF